jgi:hypothetical protein
MNNTGWFCGRGAVCIVMVLCLPAALGNAAVTADPAQATFTSPQQSAVIKLTKDGVPVPARDIRGWQFIASDHDYRHMLSVQKMDGALKIAPSRTIEVGSYDLRIDTVQGGVVVQVFAPLSELPDIVEKTAVLTGEPKAKIEEKMGLSTPLGCGQVRIDLPPLYYVGQTLELTMPAGSGCSCAWSVNGKIVAEGAGQNALTYTFAAPGEYTLTYVETDKENGRNAVVARATANTKVVPATVSPNSPPTQK